MWIELKTDANVVDTFKTVIPIQANECVKNRLDKQLVCNFASRAQYQMFNFTANKDSTWKDFKNKFVIWTKNKTALKHRTVVCYLNLHCTMIQKQTYFIWKRGSKILRYVTKVFKFQNVLKIFLNVSSFCLLRFFYETNW